MTPADRKKRAGLREQLHDLENRLPPPTPAAWAIRTEKPAETFVLKRGDPHRKLIAVAPGFPRIVAAETGKPTVAARTGEVDCCCRESARPRA